MPQGQAGHPRQRIPMLSGGMVSAFPVTVLEEEQGLTRLLKNMDFTRIPGVVHKRPGLEETDLPEAPEEIKGLTMVLYHGAPVYVIAYDDKVAWAEPGDSSWTEIQPSEWDSPEADRVNFATMGGQLIVTDGTNPPFVWNFLGDKGSGGEKLDNMPKSKYIVEHRNRLFIGGIDGDPLKVKVSHWGDPDGWEVGAVGSQAIELFPGNDQRVTGLLAMDDAVLIGQDRSLHVLTGTTSQDFAMYPLDRNVGVGSHRAAKFIDGRAFFPDQRGEVFILEQGAMPENISHPIEDYLREVNPDRIEEASAIVVDKANYVLTLPEGEEDYITVVYDVVEHRWRLWDTFARFTCEAVDPLGAYFVLRDTPKKITRLVQGKLEDYDGKPIEARLETLEMHFGAPELEKEIRTLFFGYWQTGDGADIDLFFRTNMGDWRKIGQTFRVPEGNYGDYLRVQVPINDLGRNVQFAFENNKAGEDLRLLDAVISFIPKEME